MKLTIFTSRTSTKKTWRSRGRLWESSVPSLCEDKAAEWTFTTLYAYAKAIANEAGNKKATETDHHSALAVYLEYHVLRIPLSPASNSTSPSCLPCFPVCVFLVSISQPSKYSTTIWCLVEDTTSTVMILLMYL